jgi:cell wall-associated NlpC family hydrolase
MEGRMSEQSERAAVVAEALTWEGVRYHPRARVKLTMAKDGVEGGVDCIMLPAEVLSAAGVIPRLETVPYYPPDWHFHDAEERLLAALDEYAERVPGPPERAPQPGDIVAYVFSKRYAHTVIVLEWPLCLHASMQAGIVERCDTSADPHLQNVKRAQFYNPWGPAHAPKGTT